MTEPDELSRVPMTAPKPFCFVLMPFADNFDDVYEIGIKEACDKGGAYCERVDDQIFTESMLERIYNQIAKADFIIADMTGQNPNVFYEVGYAHALGKPTILLTQDSSDIPFDLKHFQHIVYHDRLHELREKVAKVVSWHVGNPPGSTRDPRVEVILYHDRVSLDARTPAFEIAHNSTQVAFTIQNGSSRVFDIGQLEIGLLTPSAISFCDSVRIGGSFGVTAESTELPDGRVIHQISEFGKMFPEAYTSIEFTLNCRQKDSAIRQGTYECVARVFTADGCRDFDFRVEDPDFRE